MSPKLESSRFYYKSRLQLQIFSFRQTLFRPSSSLSSPSYSRRLLFRRLSPIPSHYSSHPFRLVLDVTKVLALAHLIWTHVIHIGAAEGASMLPTIPHDGVCLLILSTHRLGNGIKVGDLVSFKNPVKKGDAVKRVMGLEGDYVVWDSPDASRGGIRHDGGRRMGNGAVMLQVPKGHVWVVGDNLPASRDSRTYGPVPMALIKGKVVAQCYPWHEMHWIKNPMDEPLPSQQL